VWPAASPATTPFPSHDRRLTVWLGATITIVAVVGMVVWALHEIRRVDRIAGRHDGGEEDPS